MASLSVLLASLLSVSISDALNVISDEVVQNKLVPFLQNNSTFAFAMTNHRHRRLTKNRMNEINVKITTPMMMRKFGEAIVAMGISVEHFMQQFRRRDDFPHAQIQAGRYIHTTVGYDVPHSAIRCGLIIVLKYPPKSGLAVLMRYGKFESCCLVRNGSVHVMSERCGDILRSAYWGKEFSIQGIEGTFIRRDFPIGRVTFI